MGNAAIFAAATGGTYIAQGFDRPVTAVLIFLTGVMAIGARSGVPSGIAAAVAASFIYNFFLSQPAFRFGVTSADEIVPLVAFNISAVVTGVLTGRLKDSARAASLAGANSAFLQRISDRLQQVIRLADVTGIARQALPTEGVADLQIFIARNGELYQIDGGDEPVGPMAAPSSSEPWDDSEGAFRNYELKGAGGPLGVVKFVLPRAGEEEGELPDLQAIANLLSLAIDRCILLERLSDARALQRSEELKSAILSSVSHDLRTPLTAIAAAAGSLRSFQDSLPAQQKEEMLHTIEEQCKRLNRYTANLLDMGRIQAGISPSLFEDVDVADMLGVVLGNIRISFPDQPIQKQFDLSSTLVRANPAMLEQALFNILENAVLHGRSEEPVEVRLYPEDGHCIVEITDRGSGISAEDRPHIFERFYRSEQPVNRRGSGLGLYIANGFVQAFGGTIAVKDPAHDASGTRMMIRLPLAQPNTEAAPSS